MSELTFKQVRPDLFCAYRDNKMVGYAHYQRGYNFIDTLWVKEDCRRQGIGTGIVQFMTETLKRKLSRCPDQLKNDAVRGLSAKFGDKLGAEAKVPPK